MISHSDDAQRPCRRATVIRCSAPGESACQSEVASPETQQLSCCSLSLFKMPALTSTRASSKSSTDIGWQALIVRPADRETSSR